MPWAAGTWARPGAARRGSPRPWQARGPPVLQVAAALRSGGPQAGTSGPRRHRGAAARESRRQVSWFKLTPSSEGPLRWGGPHRGRSHSSRNSRPPRGTWSRRRPPLPRGLRVRHARPAPRGPSASLCGILQLLLSPTKGRDVLALYIYHARLSSSLPSRLSENPFPYPAVAAVNKASRLRASP